MQNDKIKNTVKMKKMQYTDESDKLLIMAGLWVHPCRGSSYLRYRNEGLHTNATTLIAESSF